MTTETSKPRKISAAEQALFDEFGMDAPYNRTLETLNPKSNDGSRPFKFSFHNGQLAVDAGYAERHQIQKFIQDANKLGLGFKADGPDRISALMASDVEPKFLAEISQNSRTPTQQSYRAEQMLDGQKPVVPEQAKALIAETIASRTDHMGNQSRDVRIGQPTFGDGGVVRFTLETEVTSKQVTTSGGRVQVSGPSNSTKPVTMEVELHPQGGTFELRLGPAKIPHPTMSSTLINAPQEFAVGAKARFEGALKETLGADFPKGGARAVAITGETIDAVHAARMAKSAAANQIVADTIKAITPSPPAAPAPVVPAPAMHEPVPARLGNPEARLGMGATLGKPGADHAPAVTSEHAGGGHIPTSSIRGGIQAGKVHFASVTVMAAGMGVAATGTALLRNEGAKESLSKGIDAGKEVLVGGVTAVMDGARKKNDGTLWSKVVGGVQGAVEHMAPEMKDGTTCQKVGGATKVVVGGGAAVVLGTAGAVIGSAVGPVGTAAGGLGGAVTGAVVGDQFGDKVTLACQIATHGINAINRAMIANKPTVQAVASPKSPDPAVVAQAPATHGREGRG